MPYVAPSHISPLKLQPLDPSLPVPGHLVMTRVSGTLRSFDAQEASLLGNALYLGLLAQEWMAPSSTLILCYKTLAPVKGTHNSQPEKPGSRRTALA